ncbi:DUF29 domain-containing protein [Endozoicomonas euniceicola]|uniref:DUF29 domain-containing protein n=1 Tax=Endozoicomonas euniceicola TaxID=1234143 RepID=A0ABY6GPU1_9GAMM|nr:DUF29 domain-containing protein [Endozoicomonas euniceicola]UYM14567.1 DUF29 domain-containing protein [Endozoicomonas euniceicola]
MDNLYHTDYPEWLNQQRHLLANGQFDRLDIPNLLEAMEQRMGDAVNELESHLIILLLHLLKYDYQMRVLQDPWVQDKAIHTWIPSINNPRTEIELLTSKNPHLKNKTARALQAAYPRAKNKAVAELNKYIRSEKKRLNQNSFPEECPWSFERIVDDDWLP